MNDIQKIYKMLQQEMSVEIQAEGVRLAKEIDDLSLLIMPPARPSVWEACAQVLSEKSDIVLEPYLDGLFEWIYDLNWPGALIILDRLKCFSGKILNKCFVDHLINPSNPNNDEEVIWLSYLEDLRDNEELISELPKPIVEKLKKH